MNLLAFEAALVLSAKTTLNVNNVLYAIDIPYDHLWESINGVLCAQEKLSHRILKLGFLEEASHRCATLSKCKQSAALRFHLMKRELGSHLSLAASQAYEALCGSARNRVTDHHVSGCSAAFSTPTPPSKASL